MSNAGAHILVVDDDPAIRNLVGTRLQHVGYRVSQAATGEEGLDLVAADGVDLVLLDIMMPGMDGFAVLERIRDRFALSVLPVIMFSAKDKSEAVIRALRLGANDYAVKPVDFQVLLKRVDVHLALKTAKGKVIGGYRIVRKIGSGGMGVVYAAEKVSTKEKVALKVLPRSLTIEETFVKRFLREATLAARIDHPNVVAILDAGRDDETYFIAMELVDGRNLGQICETEGVDVRTALAITRQVSDALAAVKAIGVLHRDIKPENVIVGSGGVAKLTDFGIARDTEATRRMTDTGVGVGSVLYASPEQIQGEGDYRSDIYSLGCTLWFMLTGEDPFDANMAVEKLLQLKTRAAPRLEEVMPEAPRQVAELLRRMLAPRPEKRFQTYVELRSAIEDALSGEKSVVGERQRAVLWVALVIGAVALAAAFVGIWRHG